MVNTVKLLRKHFLARLFKNAGLRQHALDVHDGAGTVVNLWLPKHKAPPSKTKKKASSTTVTAENHVKADGKQPKQRRHAVVLLHGFAADGLMTWAFQVGALAKRGYDVYVPDLLHFGRSTTASPDRTMAFQARCIAAALRRLGVEDRCCTVVGFSYGALVAFEMAAVPGLVSSVVATGSAAIFTGAICDALLGRLCPGTSFAELMMPESARRLRLLFSTALYMKLRWFPRRVLEDFLRHKVMCTNRQERAEMLEKMVTRDEKASTPVFQQNILLLWGENDNYVPIEEVKRMKGELGEKVTLRSIKKAGHLVHLERPSIYNRCLKEFLTHVSMPSHLDNGQTHE